MSVCCRPPYTPILYIKTGVYKGIHYFLIFSLKHILVLWVLVRTASMICFEQKNENSKKKNSTENCHFYSREKSVYIAWACFRNDSRVSVAVDIIIHVFS